MGVLTLIITSSDNIIIAHTLGSTFVAEYEIVKRLFMFSMFTNYLITPLWPAFGEALARKDYAWANKAFKRSLLISIAISIIVTLPLLMFGKQIIAIWVGDEFIPNWSLLFGYYIYIILLNYTGVMSVVVNGSNLVGKQLLPLVFRIF